jgi:transposase-like protein
MEKAEIIHIKLAGIDFKCPHCSKDYDDRNEIYLRRLNKNKNCQTRIKCSCKHTFGLTANYMGNLESYKLTK